MDHHEHIKIDAGSKKQVSIFLSQIYVIHSDGFVLLSRKYRNDCISSEPQLIGGFLSAINGFVKTTASKGTLQCNWGEGREHQIVDIGMSCSRWFLKPNGDYTVALLIFNESPLIANEMWEVIDQISARIVDSFEVFRMFSATEGTINLFLDHSDDFGHTIDNIIFETVSENLEEEIDYSEGENVNISPTD